MSIGFQQIIAFLVIIIFLFRLIRQKRAKEIGGNEFILWFSFWSLAAIAILLLKELDRLTAALGLSSSGINFLLYGAVLILFYLVFRLRLRLAKLDQDLTKFARANALQEAEKQEKSQK